jgi:C-terminal processing protease CtpA/Prc
LRSSPHEQSVDFAPIGDGTSRPVFRSLRPEDALSQCGVKNGDVLLSINAVPIESPARALEVRRRLSEDSEWRLVMSRQRQPFSVTITLQQAVQRSGVPDNRVLQRTALARRR